MDNSVSFWLENRNCAGTKAAVIGDQLLVLYRDRYYVVTGGAAQTKGSKPLRFSKSSLPSAWKRALNGNAPLPESMTGSDPEPSTRMPKRPRSEMEISVMPSPQATTTEKNEQEPAPHIAKPRKGADEKPVNQSPVMAHCPYCNVRHEIPVEKGKNGKPFFISCNRCKKEFAVRFIQVTMFQAQVAGFR